MEPVHLEGVWRRAQRTTRSFFLSLPGLAAEVIATGLFGVLGLVAASSVIGALAGVVGFLAVLGGAFLVSLVVAPFKQRNEARSALESVQTAGSEAVRVEPAEQLEALAEEGEQLRSKIEGDLSFVDAAQGAFQQWDSAATGALGRLSHAHLLVYHVWQEGARPGMGMGMTTRSRQQILAWDLGNRSAALRDIAQRFRVAAGESFGAEIDRRARLKDVLLKVEQARVELQARIPEGQATKQDALDWLERCQRLIRGALPSDAADALLSDEHFQAGDVSLTFHLAPDAASELAKDPEVLRALLGPEQHLPALQWRLSSMDLRDDFDPAYWESLWSV